MSNACAIAATFATWRPVQGRKVLQLVFEVPLEKTQEVLTMLGAAEDQWCAIARLNDKAGSSSVITGEITENPQNTELKHGNAPFKPKRKFSDLSLPEQAGIRCADESFWDYLRLDDPRSPEGAACMVRVLCGINSRAQLATNENAAERWRKLNAEYEAWMTDKNYGDLRR